MGEEKPRKPESENREGEELALLKTAVGYLEAIKANSDAMKKVADTFGIFLEEEMETGEKPDAGDADGEWLARNGIVLDDEFVRIEMAGRRKRTMGSSYILKFENKYAEPIEYRLMAWSVNRRMENPFSPDGKIPSGLYRIDEWKFDTPEIEGLVNVEGMIAVFGGKRDAEELLRGYRFLGDEKGNVSVAGDARFEEWLRNKLEPEETEHQRKMREEKEAKERARAEEEAWLARNGVVLDDEFVCIEMVGRHHHEFGNLEYVVRIENKSKEPFYYDIERFVVDGCVDIPWNNGNEIRPEEYIVDEWEVRHKDGVESLVNIKGTIAFKDPKHKFKSQDEILRRYHFKADGNGDISIKRMWQDKVFNSEER